MRAPMHARVPKCSRNERANARADACAIAQLADQTQKHDAHASARASARTSALAPAFGAMRSSAPTCTSVRSTTIDRAAVALARFAQAHK